MLTSIFISAILFSIWLIVLFWGDSLGLSVFLYVTPLSVFLTYILKKQKRVKDKKAELLLIPIILLSLTYTIFNNELFRVLNAPAIMGLLTIMIIMLLGAKFTIMNYISRAIELLMSPLLWIRENFKDKVSLIKGNLKLKASPERTKTIKTIIKGSIITIIMAVIIIALLSSADETFENIFSGFSDWFVNLFENIHISELFIKVICICISTWYLFGIFNFITKHYTSEEKEDKVKYAKENITIRMILAVLNVIYVIYCAIQIKKIININDDIVYSTCARDEFFQLMLVSFINLVTIVFSKKAKEAETEKEHLYIKVMDIIMIALTFIILISSVIKMYYYEQAYGYTYLRLLVYCALITEAIMFIPTILYVIDKKVDLLKMYFIIVVTMYVIMNYCNFDYLIAKRNIDRYFETGKLDIDYLMDSTDTDAIGQVLRLQDSEEYKLRIEAHTQAQNEMLTEENMNYKNFNFSKYRAIKLTQNIEL